MKFLKRNYGWIIVVLLGLLPLIPLLKIGIAEEENSIDMLYHISGEFAIRWMTAVLTLTPFYILFGITNLNVRQAMGIVTSVWSFIHFVLFIWIEGFLETFTQVNYVLGLLAIMILIPLFFTSSRKAMRLLKRKWKKLQRFAYAAIVLSLLHVFLLDKAWLIYAIVVGLGFIIRFSVVKEYCIALRSKK